MGNFISNLFTWICQIGRWIVALLDKHQGAFMVLLTAALVYYAYKSARAAVRNIELIKKNDDRRTLPYVVLEVVNDMPFYGVRMVNLGATAAHNVVVTSEPKIEMVFQNYRKPIKFLHEPVAYLAPSAHFETDIGSFRDIERENPPKIYSGTISFENDDGRLAVMLSHLPLSESYRSSLNSIVNGLPISLMKYPAVWSVRIIDRMLFMCSS